jgi:hypothetical protein
MNLKILLNIFRNDSKKLLTIYLPTRQTPAYEADGLLAIEDIPYL